MLLVHETEQGMLGCRAMTWSRSSHGTTTSGATARGWWTLQRSWPSAGSKQASRGQLSCWGCSHTLHPLSLSPTALLLSSAESEITAFMLRVHGVAQSDEGLDIDRALNLQRHAMLSRLEKMF